MGLEKRQPRPNCPAVARECLLASVGEIPKKPKIHQFAGAFFEVCSQPRLELIRPFPKSVKIIKSVQRNVSRVRDEADTHPFIYERNDPDPVAGSQQVIGRKPSWDTVAALPPNWGIRPLLYIQWLVQPEPCGVHLMC